MKLKVLLTVSEIFAPNLDGLKNKTPLENLAFALEHELSSGYYMWYDIVKNKDIVVLYIDTIDTSIDKIRTIIKDIVRDFVQDTYKPCFIYRVPEKTIRCTLDLNEALQVLVTTAELTDEEFEKAKNIKR